MISIKLKMYLAFIIFILSAGIVFSQDDYTDDMTTENEEKVLTTEIEEDLQDQNDEDEEVAKTDSEEDAEIAESDKDTETTESEENIVELEKEIVVGYGTAKKEDLTGSVASIEEEDLNKSAGFNIETALQGKAAGVLVTQNTGQPGKPFMVRIRGVGTITNSDPLYVVDGMPMKSIDWLNPGDIEAISVLKDASSAAIYGTRGLNGVIMITTKKGKKGESRLTYNTRIGVATPWKDPDMCNASEWVQLHNEAIRNDGDTTGLVNSYTGDTYWWDEVTRNALMQSHDFSITRGFDKLKYFVSGGYAQQDGIIKESDSRRMSLRVNGENDFSDWFKIGNTFSFSNVKTHPTHEGEEWHSTLMTSLMCEPAMEARDANGDPNASPYSNSYNPLGVIENNVWEYSVNRVINNVFADLNIAGLVTLRSSFGFDLAHTDSTKFHPSYNYDADDSRLESYLYRENRKDFSWVLENTITYKQTFGENHNFGLLGGITAEEYSWEFFNGANISTPTNDPSLQYLSATTGTSPGVAGRAGGNSLLSYLGRLNYDYAYKYLLTGSIRRDGSSKFGPENRWGLFPSFAAGWKVSEEPFMEKVTFLQLLKIRGGWGILGNQSIDNYLYSTNTVSSQKYPFGSGEAGVVNNGSTFISAGNPDIKWEEQKATNVGLDFSLWDGRIEFMGDWFLKNTSFMLVQPVIPGHVGLAISPMDNAGEVQNKGIELTLAYNEKIKSFSSRLSVNFSTYDNEVMSLGEFGEPILSVPFNNMGTVARTEIGHPIASFYGYVTDGLFQNQAQIDAFVGPDGNPLQPNAKPGDVKYKDDDGDGVLDQDFIGNPHPDFTFGIGLDFAHSGKYGELDFRTFLQGSYGNDIFNGVRTNTDKSSAYYNVDRRMLDRWNGEGSTNDVNTPRMSNASDGNNVLISDRFVEDGSYMRIKELQLGYTLPSTVTDKMKVERLRLYLGVQNLFTFTKYSGLDPEIGVGHQSHVENSNDGRIGVLDIGIDKGVYPQARTFFGGINMSL